MVSNICTFIIQRILLWTKAGESDTSLVKSCRPIRHMLASRLRSLETSIYYMCMKLRASYCTKREIYTNVCRKTRVEEIILEIWYIFDINVKILLKGRRRYDIYWIHLAQDGNYNRPFRT